jgi:hypothetical protein
MITSEERQERRLWRQSEKVGARRFVRACREHGCVLEHDGTGRLSCPAGHAITPFRGGWSVVDMRSGRIVAAATTETIEITDGLLQDAIRLFHDLHETTAPARRRHMVLV